MQIKNNKGFTLTEVFFGLIMFAAIILTGFAIYALIHFITKFW